MHYTDASHEQNRFFLDNVRRTMELIQLLKYQLEEFKTLDVTKTLPKHRNLLVPNAALMGALNSHMLKVKNMLTPETFREILSTMTRDQLRDVSLLMDVGSEIGNLEEVISTLRMEVDKAKAVNQIA